MNVPFLYLMSVVLITRLLWVFRDERAEERAIIIAGVIRLASLVPLLTSGHVWALVAGIILMSVLHWRMESNRSVGSTALHRSRILLLGLWFLLLGVLCSAPFEVRFVAQLREWCSAAGSYHVFLAGVFVPHRGTFLAYLVGVVLAVGESHVVVRCLLEAFDVKPEKPADSAEEGLDEAEYSRGRIIGCLERFIAFAFILQGAFTALVFVVAVKNLTRFNQLDERPFAEYFLIGTLLSVVCAGLAAGIIQVFII